MESSAIDVVNGDNEERCRDAFFPARGWVVFLIFLIHTGDTEVCGCSMPSRLSLP